jgi:two-component system NarL family sensor kinase
VSATPLPPLSAAVEVAAYRIVTESLTNAARHSTATRVEVVIACGDGVVQLRVCDDGGRSASPWIPGVGLRSLRDRAAELGGTFEAFPTKTGGRISACLPTEVVA